MAADERPISDFPRLTSILTTALLFTSVVSGVDSYDSRSVTTEVLARAMLGDFQYSDIDAQTVFDRINQIKVLSDTAAPSAAVGAENQIFVQIDDTGLTDVIEAIFVKYSGAWLEVPYQKSSDNNLQTTDKTIVGAINELDGELTANFDYSANEVVIGDYFGYPLYRLYFDVGQLPNNTTKSVVVLNRHIRDLVNLRIVARTRAGDSFITIPYLSSSAAFNIECDVECTNGETKVNITTHTDRSGLVAFGIIEYLKPTS